MITFQPGHIQRIIHIITFFIPLLEPLLLLSGECHLLSCSDCARWRSLPSFYTFASTSTILSILTTSTHVSLAPSTMTIIMHFHPLLLQQWHCHTDRHLRHHWLLHIHLHLPRQIEVHHSTEAHHSLLHNVHTPCLHSLF